MDTYLAASPDLAKFYQITVEGKIDSSWSDWFWGLQMASRKEAGGMFVTTLYGFLKDQAALRSLLNRLWDLNLVLRSVEQINDDNFLDIL